MHTRFSSRTRLQLGAALLGLTALAPAAYAAPGAPHFPAVYTLTLLGALPGDTNSAGFGVNSSRQVAGEADTSGPYTSLAFVSGAGGSPLQALGTLGGSTSVARGINDSGQIAGEAATKKNAAHAFLSGPNGGPLKDLGTLGGQNSVGLGINTSGQVVGDSDTALGDHHAFLSGPNGGPLKDLGTLPSGDYSTGFGVNDSGQVVGTSFLTNSVSHRAFLSGPDGGPLKDLGALGGYNSYGQAVNASGQVTGSADTDFSNAPIHAFRSAPNGGPLQDLGALGNKQDSEGEGINDSGVVVGKSSTSQGTHAFVFTSDYMFDLNSLIAPGSGFTLFEATSISNNGFITGFGTNSLGQQEAFLLTPTGAPVPEASPVVSLGLLLALGLGGWAAAARRKRA